MSNRKANAFTHNSFNFSFLRRSYSHLIFSISQTAPVQIILYGYVTHTYHFAVEGIKMLAWDYKINNETDF